MKNISEFTGIGYRDFYTMNDLIKVIGRTVKVMTWGAHGWIKMNKYLLRFRVQAHRHRGHVYIAVNGSDLFDIWLTNLKGEIKKEFKNVFIDDLISTIDDEIEKTSEYTF